MKKISIIAPTYNEELNVENLYSRIKLAISKIDKYEFEIIIIDNASTDSTVKLLKSLAAGDRNLKIIVNNRNFGHIRSPYWGVINCYGDAVIYLAGDLQDPPELIPTLIAKWEAGSKVVLGVKPKSESGRFFSALRRAYYKILNKISDVEQINDATGFGLYDQKVISEIRNINDPYPYFRGLISELGYKPALVDYLQNARKRGISKNNFYTLYDIAVLGVISHSMIPIRLASLMGFAIGVISILFGLVFFVLKLFYWDKIPMGIAPIYILMSFLLGVILIFIGILGEYIGSIHTFLKNRPIVVESERVNFEESS